MVIITSGLDLWNKVVLLCALWLVKPCAENVIRGVSGALVLDSTTKFANAAVATNVAINVQTIVQLNITPHLTRCQPEKLNENACRVTFCVEDVMDRMHRNAKLVGISKYSR